MKKSTSDINWNTRGKTISELISELRTFEDQNLEVRISTDDSESFRPISLVGRFNQEGKYFAGLIYSHDSDQKE